MPSEGSTVAKFAIPGLIGLVVAVGLLLLGRWLDTSSSDERDFKDALQRVETSVAGLKTDVAVIKAVVVDTQIAARVATLESEVRSLKEKLPK